MWNAQQTIKQYASASHLDARIALHRHYSTHPLSLWVWLRQQYHFNKGDRLLEVGCGSGAFWQQQPPPADCAVTLTDFSTAMLARCQKNLGDNNCQFQVADVMQLPFADASYDHILSHFMLYHAPSQTQALRQIKRVLKPNGIVGIVTPSARNMARLWDVAATIEPYFASHTRMIEPFCEENAHAQLASFFDTITLSIHEDVLRITASEPVAAYLKSAMAGASYTPGADFYPAFTAAIDAEIATHGSFDVAKRNALFVCQ